MFDLLYVIQQNSINMRLSLRVVLLAAATAGLLLAAPRM
jgi:hypothetical protein